MASPFVELEIGGRTVKVTNPDKVFYRKLKATKLDHVQYYVSVAEGIVRALYERPTQLKRHPDGAEERRSTRSACRRSAPSGSRRPASRFLRPACGRALRHRGRAGRVGRQSGDDRLPPLAVAARPRRQPRRAADRRRPAARHDVQGREEGCAPRPRGAGRARLHGLAQDLRQPGHPHRVSHRAELDLSGGAPVRAGVREGGRAPAAEEGHDGVVEGGARASRLHRLQPERARPDDRLGLLGARAARRDRLGAGHLGRARRCRDRGLHPADDAEALRQARRRAGGNR